MAETRPAGFAAPRPIATTPASPAGTNPAGTTAAAGQVSRPQQSRSPEAMRKTAQEFEAQMLGAMLQPMFETLPTNGPMGGGAAEAQWRPMLVEQFGKQMAKAGGVGIGDAVYRDMMRLQSQGQARSSGEKP
ncbi:rod-binding protein [Roseomonas sp. 18066]|uniref:rod-binding protein n=1 Tax=Roseomonas sp. 18066 TaxID=2681412 RepID=UPI00135AD3AB|nr:rod-binding protein [Roseomonas sp. 18066]